MKRYVRAFLTLTVCLALSFSSVLASLPAVQAAETGTWTQLPAGGGTVTSLAINPANPAIVYAATNDCGVFRSTDSGVTWMAVNNGLSGNEAGGLVIDPVTPAIVYVLVSGDIFRSTDSGATWILASSDPAADASCLAIDPTTPSILYAGGRSTGVIRSFDSGATWSYGGLGSISASSLVINPVTPSTLYAVTNYGVYRSTDSGANWAATNAGLVDIKYVNCLAIDPLTPTTLYVGTTYSGVFRSTDAGTTWTAVNTGLPGWSSRAVTCLAIDPVTPTTLYAGSYPGVCRSTDGGSTWEVMSSGLTTTSVKVLAVNPLAPTTLYVGTEFNGVFRSTDRGTTWTPVSTTLTNAYVACLAIDPVTPAILYAGTNGGLFKSSDCGEHWAVLGGDLPGTSVYCLAIDPLAPSTLYAGTGAGLFRSRDGGSTWRDLGVGLLPGRAVNTVSVNPLVPSILYANGYGGLFKSTDSGDTWIALSGATGSVTIDPVTPSILYAGSGSGIVRSTDSGVTWTPAKAGLPETGVYSLAIDPVTSSTLYAGTFSGGVFKTTNRGVSWTATGAALAGVRIDCLAIDPVMPTTLYAGTFSGGVFTSTDGGGNWAAMNDGLANRYVSSLAIHPSAHATLYAGTTGGGVFRYVPSGSPTPAYALTAASSPSIGGSISKSPDQPSYSYGTLVTVTATPWPRYQLVGWTVNGCSSGSVNPIIMTMDADKFVVATFAQLDAFEPDNDRAHASSIAPDGSLQRHNFAVAGDEDWAKFTAVGGTTYTIDTLNLESACDTGLQLYGPYGMIDSSDDGDNLASRIDFECPKGKDGTYYVRVQQANGRCGLETGYDLRIEPALQISFSNIGNAGKDYGLADVVNHVTVTVTRGGIPVQGASVNVDSGEFLLTTNAVGQASLSYPSHWGDYSYVRATIGSSKPAAAYFWFVDGTFGLISVKPMDIDGYYLTHFNLSTFQASGEQWWSLDSGTSNTAVLPSTGVGVATAPGDQHGGRGYVFTLDPALEAGQKAVLTPMATVDCVALSVCAAFEGEPLANACVFIRNQGYASTTSSYAAHIDPSGTSLTYVTPGTYTAVVTESNSGSPCFWLTKKDIAASTSTTTIIAVTRSQLSTVTCTGRDGNALYASVQYSCLYLQSEGISTSLWTTPSNFVLLVSPGTYQALYDYIYMYLTGPSEIWGYGFDCGVTWTVAYGLGANLSFGGPLRMVTSTPSRVTPGQAVTTTMTVVDGAGHRLCDIYDSAESSFTSPPDELMKGADHRALLARDPVLAPDSDTDSRPLAEADAWSYVSPRPHLTITDPSAAAKVERQDVSLDSAYRYGYTWTVPADATLGIWHAVSSLDSGPYQGMISSDQAFAVGAVSPLTLTSPNGSESWVPGSVQTVGWTVAGDTSSIHHFSLFYTVDGGNSWERAGFAASSDRTFSWTVPDRFSSHAKVIVYAMDAASHMLAYDASDSFFTMAPAGVETLPSISLIYPSAQTWAAGTTQTISWSLTGSLPASFHHYSIYASLEDGRNGSWFNVGYSTVPSLSWPISAAIGSAHAKIVVYAMDASSHLLSDAIPATFVITPATGVYTLSLTSPALGTTLHVGEVTDVTWARSGILIPQLSSNRVYYSVDCGLSWEYAGSSTASPFSWMVPARLSPSCSVMVVATDALSNVLGVATSSNFAIAP